MNALALIVRQANIAIDWTMYTWITRNYKQAQEEYDSKTHHLDDVQSFVKSGDEDADDDVADASYWFTYIDTWLYCMTHGSDNNSNSRWNTMTGAIG